MIGEEPYRWLEAINNRREYIEDQLRSARPVVAVAGKPGVLLLTARRSTPKLFEIYDHLALGCLGHPADIERVRMAAIDTAHLEGFARSPQDVGSRRLASYSLAPAIKAAFEQIFAAPLMFRGVLAEVAAESARDQLWSIDYDGTYRETEPGEARHGLVVAARKATADAWTDIATRERGAPANDTWAELSARALRLLVWALEGDADARPVDWRDFPKETAELGKRIDGELEAVVLDRALLPNISYRVPSPVEIGL